MKLILAAAGLIFLAGCASPYQNQKPFYMVNVEDDRAELTGKRVELETKKKRLSSSKLKEEIEALQAEISELEKRIAALELSIANSEKEALRAKQATSLPTSNPTTNRGPRGGCYTITKSGKKNYGGC